MTDLGDYTDKVVQAGYSPDSEVYKAVSDIIVALGQHDLLPDEKETVLDLVSRLGRQDLLGFPGYTEDDWGDFDYGNARPGHYVRVRPDTYDSPTGKVHNGLVGVVVRISGRRCTVRYLANPESSPMTHPIQNIQSIKTVVRLKTDLQKMKEK